MGYLVLSESLVYDSHRLITGSARLATLFLKQGLTRHWFSWSTVGKSRQLSWLLDVSVSSVHLQPLVRRPELFTLLSWVAHFQVFSECDSEGTFLLDQRIASAFLTNLISLAFLLTLLHQLPPITIISCWASLCALGNLQGDKLDMNCSQMQYKFETD